MLVYKNGDYYLGDLQNGIRHNYSTDVERDVFRRMIYANGNVYEGQWALDEKSFNGTMTYVNGDVYSGEWRHDMKEGQGKYLYKETGDVYKGQWRGSLKEGQGSLYFRNLNVFFGLFANNQPVEEVGVIEDYSGK